jgi:hypothetical protein
MAVEETVDLRLSLTPDEARAVREQMVEHLIAVIDYTPPEEPQVTSAEKIYDAIVEQIGEK